ncbi:MAG: 2-oxo acid dehydrogenase subunit E2 [Actinobacteria bacterium]|nr:2-oxo acid dehydrogenase subunit E2 [Actinomycetota bacterium]
MPDFLLPDLGEGLAEAEVIEWRVRVGDQVATDQTVVEVETAKAAVEVPVPFAGTVTALHADPGTMVAVGQPLITVGPAAAEEASGNVLIGYGTTASPGTRRRRGRRRPQNHSAGPVRVISPLVRKLARDAGLDLTAIHGSGPSGIIRRADIELAAQANQAAPATPLAPAMPLAPATPITSATPVTSVPSAPSAPSATETTRIPLRGTRRAIADKLTRSRREIPEATVWVDVDVTDLLTVRTQLNARTPDRPVSILALFARFTVLALRRYPELNAHLDGDEIVIPDHVHLGFAAQTDRGLVVPVVRDAHQLSARDLSAALTAHTAAARAGQLSPAELTGGTITVNNYGVFGVDGSAAIINHPEVAIIGLGRIIDRPWVVDGELAVRQVTELTLAFDHRVCDGGTAGGFLRTLADYLEDPVTALGDL